MPRAIVDRDYLELWKLMMQTWKPDADLAEIRSFFENGKVVALADELENALDSISDATKETDIEPLFKKENTIEERLLKAMGKEAKAPSWAIEVRRIPRIG